MLPPVLKFIPLKGYTTTTLILLPLPQAAVQHTLPKGLSLASQKLTPAGTHPVLFIFTEEQEVYVGFKGLKLLPLQEYRAFRLQIPYVRKNGNSQLYSYPARLYLNRVVPTLVGLLNYSLPQRFIKIEANQTGYDIKSLRNIPLLSSQFEPVGERAPLSAFPNFQRGMLQTLNQPSIIKYPPLKNGPGAFFCIGHTYALEESQTGQSGGRLAKPAQLQPVNAKLQLFRQFAQEFLPNSAGNYTTTNIKESPLGAFHLWSGWSLGPCYRRRPDSF
jgi:hypothetical protein